jgi:hypothetical protein
MNYSLACRIGFHPWEDAEKQPSFTDKFSGSARLQDGDQRGRAELEQAFEVAAAAGLEDHAARALVNLATITAELQATVHRSW